VAWGNAPREKVHARQKFISKIRGGVHPMRAMHVTIEMRPATLLPKW
jgi:hypothetical protein